MPVSQGGCVNLGAQGGGEARVKHLTQGLPGGQPLLRSCPHCERKPASHVLNRMLHFPPQPHPLPKALFPQDLVKPSLVLPSYRNVLPAVQDLPHKRASFRVCLLYNPLGQLFLLTWHHCPPWLGTSRHWAISQGTYEMSEERLQVHGGHFPSSLGALVSEQPTSVPANGKSTAALHRVARFNTKNTENLVNF